MLKEKVNFLRDYIIEHGKIAFPVIVIAAVAFTVVFALNASNTDAIVIEQDSEQMNETVDSDEAEEGVKIKEVSDAAIVENNDPALLALFTTYCNAYADGDVDTIRTICNYVSDIEAIKIEEYGKYLESDSSLEIYTKEGPIENSYIVFLCHQFKFYPYDELLPGLKSFFVCTDENGELYINEDISQNQLINQNQLEEIINYLNAINGQADVLELSTRVNVECKEVYINNIELFDYASAVASIVNEVIGETLAAKIAENEGGESVTEEGLTEEGTGDSTSGEDIPQEYPPDQEELIYAKTTATVNVRSSDSEQADRVNRVTDGERVQILEQRANGWSKVKYENMEGYIKSEYLELEAIIEGGEVIGSLRADSNVNIRAAASETADKIGIIAGGDTVDLISTENGWYKIKYNSIIGYVRGDLLQ